MSLNRKIEGNAVLIDGSKKHLGYTEEFKAFVKDNPGLMKQAVGLINRVEIEELSGQSLEVGGLKVTNIRKLGQRLYFEVNAQGQSFFVKKIPSSYVPYSGDGSLEFSLSNLKNLNINPDIIS